MKGLVRLTGGTSTLVVLRYEALAGAGLVSGDELAWQLAMLRDQTRPIPLSDVGLYLRGRSDLPRRGVAVTFDAADALTLSVATEELAKYDVPATFFAAIAELDGAEERWTALRSLRGGRFDVGSRTLSGRPLRGRPADELRDELLRSRHRIEEMLGQTCAAVAYPGLNDADERAPLAETGLAGYRIGVSRCEGRNVVGALEPFAIRRATITHGMGRAAFAAALKTGRVAR